MMRLFIAGSLLSLLLAASCDLATSNTLKDVAVDREACEEECAADAPSPVCDVNNAQYPNRCSAETCARVRLDEIKITNRPNERVLLSGFSSFRSVYIIFF